MPSLAQIAVALSCAVGFVAAAPAVQPRDASFTGDLTFYAPGLGACGSYNTDAEAVVALSAAQFVNSNPCGKTITITKDGKTATATVVDKCPVCADTAIDVTTTVFQSLVSLDVGRTTVTWYFND
ncbi:RlpA-like double-psi beta-barrel-protein domain-containing protein-containing protein [Camillea tinctor]|nr:RlpA-like double-psi beta-barrel-protein domain-containing protein-containing protein [Camillea tinctor]